VRVAPPSEVTLFIALGFHDLSVYDTAISRKYSFPAYKEAQQDRDSKQHFIRKMLRILFL